MSTDECCMCYKAMKFGERGGCWHENGLGHHIECTLTIEIEEEILNAYKAHNRKTTT